MSPVVIVQTRGLVSFQVTELDTKGKIISTTDVGIGQEQDFIAVAGHEYRIKVV